MLSSSDGDLRVRTATLQNGGKRIATVLMFLQEPESGGETSFPHGKPLPAVKERLRGQQGQLSDCGWRDGRGMAVRPKVGDAILFFSFKKDGNVDPGSMHASCPTLGEGARPRHRGGQSVGGA